MTRVTRHPVAHRLRDAVDADHVFCRELILATVGIYWTADPGEQLAESHARKFGAEWPDDLLPSSRIIEVDGQPAGLLTVYPQSDRVFVRYLLIDAAHQSRGIGEVVLGRVLDEARPLPTELKVDRGNTGAQRFYQRLNFRVVETADTYHRMRYEPETARTDD